MSKQTLIVVAVLMVVFGATLLANVPPSGTWKECLTVDLDSFSEVSSSLTVSHMFAGFKATSTSEFYLPSFIWQEFRMTGSLGVFGIQGTLLFGPSTANYIYGQLLVKTQIAGGNFGFYTAQVTAAVLGGPADGSVIRLAGSIGAIHIVDLFELGARIEDEEFDGITIYHAATGSHKHYTTNPIVPAPDGSCCGGFTGEKLTVAGLSFGCISEIEVMLHMTYQGFDYLKFSLAGIESGISFISFAVDLTFKFQTKALVVIPRLNMGKLSCLELYLDILTGYGTMASINGLELYGLEFISTFGNMTIKDLSVFNTGKYAITTEEYGSVIEARATAMEKDHEFYPDYWEMFSIAMSGDGCRGGNYTFLANVYFQCNSPSLFDWGMTHIEALVPISTAISLTGEIQVNIAGLNHFILGFEMTW